MGATIPLFRLSLTEKSPFTKEINRLLKEVDSLRLSDYKFRRGVRSKRKKLCALMVDGLYQAYFSHTPDTTVALPLSPKFYGDKDPNRISAHSYRDARIVHDALLLLGWIKTVKGYATVAGKNMPTTMRAAGDLEQAFKDHVEPWQRVCSTGDPLVLKSKHAIKKNRIKLPIPVNAKTKVMRRNLHAINGFLSDQAICLGITNARLRELSLNMAKSTYQFDPEGSDNSKKARALSFYHVHLRRIFARGKMTCGGRFYGGWWQNVPKEFRRYITINGAPTAEVDFSTLHPTLLCLENDLVPPDDFYDLGIRVPGFPHYDPDKAPYKVQRAIIKHFGNALINDLRGVHKLSSDSATTLGMDTHTLRALLIKTHPVFAKAIKSDAGVRYQFIDSEIAQAVMLRLMAQNIVCLPVHDSFLAIDSFLPELQEAMHEAFHEVMAANPHLKQAELPVDGFEVIYKDTENLITESQNNFHQQYVLSWRKQNLLNDNRTCSIFEPRITLPEQDK